MKSFGTITAGTVLAAFLAGAGGCNQMQSGLAPGAGTSRSLGDVSYEQAFAAGRQVMGQYFSVDPAETNVNTGMIHTRPRAVNAGNERLLGNSPARQVATMKISRSGGPVTAQVLVRQERQGGAPKSTMGYARERDPDYYSGNPGDISPADRNAATTPEQNEAWILDKPSVPDMESKILQDLLETLHGGSGE